VLPPEVGASQEDHLISDRMCFDQPQVSSVALLYAIHMSS